MSVIVSGAAEFKVTDAGSYDSVTPEFERFTDRFSAGLAERLVSLAQLAAGERVLDIGSGTGIVTLAAASRVGPSGEIIGIDLSDGMLSAAREKTLRAGFGDRVDFRKMDAEELRFSDASFDSALSLFALLHFPDPLGALREMFRVLRPGGKLVIAVGSGPPWFSLAGLAHRVRRLFETLLQVRGKRLFAPNFLNGLVEKRVPVAAATEESALARTHQSRTRSVSALVREAGFRVVRCDWKGQEAVVETPEEFWDLQRTFSSLARKRLSQASPQIVHAVREEFLRTCRAVQSRGGRLVYPFAAFYVIARRP
jgi:ubiquinone/menaquinone biosynthesis C-methylase UbiE